MTKLFKISLVALAVLAGASVAQAGDYDKHKSFIDQVIEDQKQYG